MIEYRVLPTDEFSRLSFIFEPRGLPLPDSSIERVGIGEEDGQIVSMGILRYLPLLDGLWTEKSHRGGKIDFRKLAEIVEKPLTEIPNSRCYSMITSSLTKRIVEDLGYKSIDCLIFEKEF